MISPGQKMYERFAELTLQLNCSVDRWDELVDEDKQVWEQLAEEYTA